MEKIALNQNNQEKLPKRQAIEEYLGAIFSNECICELKSSNNYTGELEISDDLRDIVQISVDGLSELEKNVVQLRFWNNYNLDEIAEELGDPKSLIETAYNDALSVLKESILDQICLSEREEEYV